jgi:hypothetical protein
MDKRVTAVAGVRQVLSLDGSWQIAKCTLTEQARTFDRHVSVLGLADMATLHFIAPFSPAL